MCKKCAVTVLTAQTELKEPTISTCLTIVKVVEYSGLTCVKTCAQGTFGRPF